MYRYEGTIARVKDGNTNRWDQVWGKEIVIRDVYNTARGFRFSVEFLSSIHPYIQAGHIEEGWRQHEIEFGALKIIWEV
jgi:hypothetical protein